MIELCTLVEYTSRLLNAEAFRDYCPNGLQVEGRQSINKLVTGVTASQLFIDAAIAAGADAILVHHGFFWKDELPVVTGMKRKRLLALLAQDISLLVYHLPLDAHLRYGNNAMLARQLQLHVKGVAESGMGKNLLFYGELQNALPVSEFAEHIHKRLGRLPLMIEASTKPVRSIAWCTGGAQRMIDEAIQLGVDTFLTGEASEATTHVARENGVHFFAAGHHATERYGVQALGAHLAEQFFLQHEFIDIYNPV